jgi:hypothetical protein
MRCTADRFDQHSATYALRTLGGEREVLQREVVLFLWGAVLNPVSVQGVEGPAAQPLT